MLGSIRSVRCAKMERYAGEQAQNDLKRITITSPVATVGLRVLYVAGKKRV